MVVVPVLYHLFKLMNVAPDVAIHMAVGTSLATIFPTSIASFSTHAGQHKAVDRGIPQANGASPLSSARRSGGYVANLIIRPRVERAFRHIRRFHRRADEFHATAFAHEKQPSKGFAQPVLASLIGFISAVPGCLQARWIDVGADACALCGVPIHPAIGTASAPRIAHFPAGTRLFSLCCHRRSAFATACRRAASAMSI